MTLQIDTASIQSAARRLEVIGNNIANANTVGFKSSAFEDVLGTAMASDTGTKAAGTTQSFSQGNITANSNPLNVAVSGNGMFRMLDSKNNPSYTRDGQFSLSKDGYVVNSTGDYLSGYDADAEGKLLLTGTATKLQIDTSDSKPVATSAATLNINLNSSADAIPAATTFDPKIASSYTHSTTTTVFDDKGEKHDVQSFYIKRDATNWDVKVTVDGVMQAGTNTLTFDSSGKLTTGSTKTFDVTIGDNTVAFDLSSIVQFGSPFAATMSQNGNDVGQMTGYKVGADGVIKAQYSNGQSMLMGQIILYNFKNLNGLAPTQNNQWVETAASGAAIAGTPGSMGLGSLQGSSTEDSNVDLTVEMIKLISAQRAFQAASEVVKKQDEILQGVVHIGG